MQCREENVLEHLVRDLLTTQAATKSSFACDRSRGEAMAWHPAARRSLTMHPPFLADSGPVASSLPHTPRIERTRLPPLSALGAMTDRQPLSGWPGTAIAVSNYRARPLPLSARGGPAPPELLPRHKEKNEVVSFQYPRGMMSVTRRATAEPYELVKAYEMGQRLGGGQLGKTVFPLNHVDSWDGSRHTVGVAWRGKDSWPKEGVGV
eukprot:2408950-Prymnesium_polylepis.2